MSRFTKGMTVAGGPDLVITPVTRKQIEARGAIATASVRSVIDVIIDPPGVRDGARQTPLSARQGKSTSLKQLILNANKIQTAAE